MNNILILGGGRVGSAIAYDLAQKQSVTVVDINETVLQKLHTKYNIKVIQQDISKKKNLKKLLKPYDLIISAVPGFMGFNTLKTIIANNKDVVDISFFPEDALQLDKLAKKHKVTALVDFGVAPGLGNIIFGYYDNIMKIQSYECYVGGLPKIKQPPFEYKAPFSPIDVIEEYIRPARLFKNHKVITKKPLTDIEIINFETNEDLEAFNTDGLRSLLYTMSHVPNMKEKTLRYPGHAQKIQLLKDIGFFSEEKKELNNKRYTPLEITSDLLKKDWLLNEKEEEFTVMRIIIQGENKKITVDLYDEYHKKTNITSMARTTGYTCTAGSNLIINKIFNKKGVFPPELIGQHKSCYNFIINYLKERTINLTTHTI